MKTDLNFMRKKLEESYEREDQMKSDLRFMRNKLEEFNQREDQMKNDLTAKGSSGHWL